MAANRDIKQDRIDAFDFMKAVAIISVVIGHIVQFGFGISDSLIIKFIGLYQMPIFFFVSGYFSYSAKPIDIKHRLTKFCKRSALILITLFIWFYFIPLLYKNEHIFYVDLHNEWFLQTLFFCTLIMYISNEIKHLFPQRVILGILILVIPCIFFILLSKVYKINYYFGIPINAIGTYYRYFLIGYFLHEYKIAFEFINKDWIYACSVIVFIFAFAFVDFHNIALIFSGAIGAFIILWRLGNSFKFSSRFGKLILYIGQSTLAIYAIHPILINMVRNNLITANSLSFINLLILSFIYCIIIITFCLTIQKIVSLSNISNFIFFGSLKKIS